MNNKIDKMEDDMQQCMESLLEIGEILVAFTSKEDHLISSISKKGWIGWLSWKWWYEE